MGLSIGKSIGRRYPAIDAIVRPGLEAVIRRIHGAAGKDDQWDGVLSCVRQLLSGRWATLAMHHFPTGQGDTIFQAPRNAALQTAYADKYSVRNPWFLSSLDYQAGCVMTGEELLRSDQLVRTDFYQEFLKQYGIFHRLCGVLVRKQDVTYYAAVFRGEDQPAFDDADKKLLESILPDLTLGLENHWALLHARSVTRVLWSVVDRLAHAVFLVENDGRILCKNDKSDEFLEQFQGLRIKDARIAARARVEDLTLLEAIREVADAAAQGARETTRVTTVSSPTTKHPVMITLRPVCDLFCNETGEYRHAAMLIAKDPNGHSDPQFCSFASMFDLTPAQTRLTALILSGHSLADASKRLNVSENTVRSHLKQIYSKTNTHGQMELVHLHSKVCTDHF